MEAGLLVSGLYLALRRTAHPMPASTALETLEGLAEVQRGRNRAGQEGLKGVAETGSPPQRPKFSPLARKQIPETCTVVAEEMWVDRTWIFRGHDVRVRGKAFHGRTSLTA